MIWRRRHQKLSLPASEQWRLDWSVSEAPSSTLYRLSAASKREGGYVSVTKKALSQAHQSCFLERAKLLQSRGAPLVTYGFDSNGCGFITWNFSSAKTILFDDPALDIRRFRYLSALLCVEALHESEMLHGGLSASSFIVDGKNTVYLFDIVSTDDSSEEKKATGEFAAYWMPEGEGAQAAFARDVYALGVLGLSCFGARFASRVLDDEGVGDGLQSLREDAPRWVHSVLAPIVSDPKNLRVHNVSNLLAAIAVDERLVGAEHKQGEHSEEAVDVSLEELAALMQRGAKRKRALDIHSMINSRRGVVVLGSALLCALILGGFLRMELNSSSVGLQAERIGVATALPSPRVELAEISEVDVFLELKSGDNAQDSKRVQALWNRLVDERNKRGEESSLLRALSSYIATIGFNNPEHVAFLAQFADHNVSVEDKARNIERYVQDHSDGAGAIVVALADEAGEAREQYRKALLNVLCRDSCEEFLEHASTETLLLLVDTSGVLSESDVERYADKLSRAETWRVLESYADRRDRRLSSIVKSQLKHKRITGISAAYLSPLIQKSFDSRVPQSSLIASARDGVSRGDLNQFLRWNGQESVGVLVASLAAKDEMVVSLALSALASKPIEDPLLYSLVQLARSANGDERVGYTSLVIAVGIHAVLPREELREFVRQASPVLISDSKAITAIVQHGGDDTLHIVLQEYGESIHPTVLLRMLDSESATIRKQVLPFLKQVRVQSVRQAVLRRYLEEKDEAVRGLYEQLGLLE